MSYIDPARLENALAFAEQQQQAEAAQQHLQAEFEQAMQQHPDVDPQELADNAENFGWDFHATAAGLREFYANNRPAPRTIGDAVDAFMADQRAG